MGVQATPPDYAPPDRRRGGHPPGKNYPGGIWTHRLARTILRPCIMGAIPPGPRELPFARRRNVNKGTVPRGEMNIMSGY